MEKATKVKLSESERLEARQKQLDEARKENAKKLKAAKRREARKQAQAKKEAEQAEAVRIWDYCKRTDITISTTVNGEKKSLQLAEYIRYVMEIDSRRQCGAPGRAQ